MFTVRIEGGGGGNPKHAYATLAPRSSCGPRVLSVGVRGHSTVIVLGGYNMVLNRSRRTQYGNQHEQEVPYT